MKFLIFTCLLVIAISASTLEEQGAEFEAFKLQHGKTYRNQVEETKRFNIFQNNLLEIEEHNALYEQGLVSWKKGVTQFADMTQEEFKAWLTLSSSNKPNFNATKHVKTGLAVPVSVDWRAHGQVTGIKNQGNCGSCWAFSVVGSTEAAYARKSGKLVPLSEQQLIDCTTDINDGCGGGHIHETFPYVEEYGLESEKSYPYYAHSDTCKYSASNVVAKISDFKCIDFKDEDTMLDAVGNIGPISVGMDATFLSLYHSGIYEDTRCYPVYLNHALVIVGYGREGNTDYWIVKNSWGRSFGEQGYFRIKRGSDECGIAEDVSYPSCN